MAIDLGDVYPLAVNVTDNTGVAANATACTVTVTLPDLTVVTPAVTNTVTGTYTASFPTTLVGHHDVRWVATGTNACTYSDEFNVAPADLGGVISLADAKAGLGVTGTSKDEDIRSVIQAATPILEDLVGPILRVTRVETYDGGTSQINLMWAPIVSITSIIESYGSTYTRTLTAQDIFAGGSLDTFGYSVDLVTGIVTRRAAGVAIPFALGKRNVQITYVSGRVSARGNVLRATRMLIRDMWTQEQQRVPLVNGQPQGTTMIRGFADPNAVIEMCGDDTRAPGLA